MSLGFTRQMLGAMYVHLMLIGDHSPPPITLLSVVSELFSGISSVSPYQYHDKMCEVVYRTRVVHCPGGLYA